MIDGSDPEGGEPVFHEFTYVDGSFLIFSLVSPIILGLLFSFWTISRVWVSAFYLACVLVALVGAILSIPLKQETKTYRKLLPFLILATWTINWILIWAMIDLKLSSSTSACFLHPLSRIDSFYFSVTTLTRLGSGRFSPASQSCILGVGIQSALDWVVTITFIAIFIARYFGFIPRRTAASN